MLDDRGPLDEVSVDRVTRSLQQIENIVQQLLVFRCAHGIGEALRSLFLQVVRRAEEFGERDHVVFGAGCHQAEREFFTSCEDNIEEHCIIASTKEIERRDEVIPVSKHPDLRHAKPQAANTPVLGNPHFSEISRASDHFSATTSESRNLRKLIAFDGSIGISASQPLFTTDLMISAYSRMRTHSGDPPRT